MLRQAIGIGFLSGIVYALAKVKQTKAKAGVLPVSNPITSASSQSMRDGFGGKA